MKNRLPNYVERQLIRALGRNENGTASARTSDPGANIGRVLRHTIWMKASISRRSGGDTQGMLRKLLRCCERECSMLRTVVYATSNERCLHRCCEFVCGMLRAACVQHSVFRKKVPKGPRALFLPRPWLSRGVRVGRPNLRFAHREEWVWHISSRGSSAPCRMDPSPTAQEPLLDALFEGSLRIR
jgi:hypothetical protein